LIISKFYQFLKEQPLSIPLKKLRAESSFKFILQNRFAVILQVEKDTAKKVKVYINVPNEHRCKNLGK
jgi:hypothetical protein